MNDKIFSKNEIIYGIPNVVIYRQLIEILRIEGYTIHRVMDNRDQFDTYPHIHNAGSYIGASCASPGTCLMIWVYYEDFIKRLYDHVTKPEEDWRDKLSELFEDKIKSYGKEVHSSNTGHKETGSTQSKDQNQQRMETEGLLG